MSVETLTSAPVAPVVENDAVLDAGLEDMLADVEAVDPAPKVPELNAEISAEILRLVQLARAA